MILPAFAQSPQPRWIADVRTGCRISDLFPDPGETVNWTGACLNGIAQGRGVLEWFQNGKPNGRYEGEVREGKLDGQGVFTWPDGQRYEGEFRDGRRDGHGILVDFNGNRYEGEWHNDKLNGPGVAVDIHTGARYEGEFRDDKAHGFGTFWRPSGTVYRGTWKDGCFKQGEEVAAVGKTPADCGF